MPGIGDAGDGDHRLFSEGLQQCDWLSVKPPVPLVFSAMAPIGTPSRSSGSATIDSERQVVRRSGVNPGVRGHVPNVDDLPSSIARPGD